MPSQSSHSIHFIDTGMAVPTLNLRPSGRVPRSLRRPPPFPSEDRCHAAWTRLACRVGDEPLIRPQDRREHRRRPGIFSGTGVTQPGVDPCRYVTALAGADIRMNPPPPADVLAKLDATVAMSRLERMLVAKGIEKFMAPQSLFLGLIAAMRRPPGLRPARPLPSCAAPPVCSAGPLRPENNDMRRAHLGRTAFES